MEEAAVVSAAAAKAWKATYDKDMANVRQLAGSVWGQFTRYRATDLSNTEQLSMILIEFAFRLDREGSKCI